MNFLNTAANLFSKLGKPNQAADREVIILLADSSKRPKQRESRRRFGRHRSHADIQKPIFSGKKNPPEL